MGDVRFTFKDMRFLLLIDIQINFLAKILKITIENYDDENNDDVYESDKINITKKNEHFEKISAEYKYIIKKVVP